MSLNIKPFKALRYNYEQGLKAQDLITQPYDKIEADDIKRYMAQSPYNVIRLILDTDPAQMPAENFYERSFQYLQKWIQEKVLIQEIEPAFYVYHQSFQYQGVKKTRKGFIGLTQLYPYSAQKIFPHERTLSGPKQDRLNLLAKTQTNYEQIFLIYNDLQDRINQVFDQAIRGQAPMVTMKDEYDSVHELWNVKDPVLLTQVQALMSEQKLVIADGHHRYESALKYAETHPDAACQYVMATFVNTQDLLILPTHRLVHSLSNFDRELILEKLRTFYKIDLISFKDVLDIEKKLQQIPVSKGQMFLLDSKQNLYQLTPIDLDSLRKETQVDQVALRELDVVLLHQVILQKILGISIEDQAKKTNLNYYREIQEAVLDLNKNQNSQLLFLIRPCEVEQVLDVAIAGASMPQKSTDFFPKMLSGFVFCQMTNQG